MQVCLDRP